MASALDLEEKQATLLHLNTAIMELELLEDSEKWRHEKESVLRDLVSLEARARTSSLLDDPVELQFAVYELEYLALKEYVETHSRELYK
jgi:hypothetical protein